MTGPKRQLGKAEGLLRSVSFRVARAAGAALATLVSGASGGVGSTKRHNRSTTSSKRQPGKAEARNNPKAATEKVKSRPQDDPQEGQQKCPTWTFKKVQKCPK